MRKVLIIALLIISLLITGVYANEVVVTTTQCHVYTWHSATHVSYYRQIGYAWFKFYEINYCTNPWCHSWYSNTCYKICPKCGLSALTKCYYDAAISSLFRLATTNDYCSNGNCGYSKYVSTFY